VVMVGVAVRVAALCRRALEKMVETVETEVEAATAATAATEGSAIRAAMADRPTAALCISLAELLCSSPISSLPIRPWAAKADAVVWAEVVTTEVRAAEVATAGVAAMVETVLKPHTIA